jgi:hypothetical protein
MSDTTRDLMVVVDEYLVRTNRKINERNRLMVIGTNPAWRSRYKAWKEVQKQKALNATRPVPTTSAQDQAVVKEWLDGENSRRRAHNDQLTTGVGLPMLELGYSAGMITFENALFAAREAHAEKVQAYDDALVANTKAFIEYGRAEEQRAGDILTKPYPAKGIGRKHLDNFDVVPMTDETLAYYAEHYTPVDLMATKNVQRNLAASSLGTTFSPAEESRLDAFLLANQLDIIEGCYVAAFKVLCDEKVIRRTPMSVQPVTIPEPKLPTVTERPVEASEPQGRAAQEAQRLADTLREIRSLFGEYLSEIEQHDAKNPAEDIVIFNAYDEMLKNRIEITREQVRKHFFYAALKTRGERPSGFTDSEIDSWVAGTETHNMSAAETKRQLEQYGNLSISRMPDKTQELLKTLVSKLGQKA